MLKVGVSLPLEYVAGCEGAVSAGPWLAAFGEPRQGLATLRHWGVTHVELRDLNAGTPAAALKAAWLALLREGLLPTIHCATPAQSCPRIEDAFPALAEGLAVHGPRAPVTLTMHALAGLEKSSSDYAEQTVEVLTSLAAGIASRGVPVRLALENNRQGQRLDPSTTCEGMLAMLHGLAGPVVGVCWDFGHMWANIELWGAAATPPVAFVRRVIHAHVHAFDGATHRPLASGMAPLKRWVAMLTGENYRGVYNLELSPNRTTRGLALDVKQSIEVLCQTVAEAQRRISSDQSV